MRFKFCGDADCPDWVLAEINTISKMSSIKLKLLTQVVAEGIVNPPIDLKKAEKLFEDSKLDVKADLEACIACISHVIKSTIKYNCDSAALHAELQQLGLPREHSTSIKRIVDEYSAEITAKFKKTALKVNPLESFKAEVDDKTNCALIKITIGDGKEETTRQVGEEGEAEEKITRQENSCYKSREESVLLTPHTLNAMIENLNHVKKIMNDLQNNPYVLYK